MATGSLMKRSNGLPLSRKNGTRGKVVNDTPSPEGVALVSIVSAIFHEEEIL